mmetsp:Transcript_20151/g.33709  ORF Transcript_20151/g.33709 Transcript_20151/m.33709 type:complete len:358 (+) Transcript_20151:374-1447(+)
MRSAMLCRHSLCQAEHHLVMAFCFGVKEVIVAINKMDASSYSQEAYELVKSNAQKMLKKAGFKPDQATFVPISAVKGVGILPGSSSTASKKHEGDEKEQQEQVDGTARLLDWYTGPCLLQALDEVPLPKRNADKALRITVDEVHRANKADPILCGRVERGVLEVDDVITLYPQGPSNARVASLQLHGSPVAKVTAGDCVGMKLELTHSVNSARKRGGRGGGATSSNSSSSIANPRKGMLITLSRNPPIPTVTRFEAQVLILRTPEFRVGYKPAITTHWLNVSVHVTDLVEILGKNNSIQERNPTSAKKGQTVICRMTAETPFAAEAVHDAPRLSRFLVLDGSNHSVSALGFVKRILQ